MTIKWDCGYGSAFYGMEKGASVEERGCDSGTVISQPHIYGPPLPLLPHPTGCQCDLLSLNILSEFIPRRRLHNTCTIAKIFPGRKGL